MTDLPSEIFKRYGGLAILLSLMCAFIIGGLAHWAASPGSEVSVLWGLVKYTKPDKIDSPSSLPDTSRQKSTQPIDGAKKDAGVVPFSPIHIDVTFDLKTEDVEQAILFLRTKHRLREIDVLESGKTVAELPRGTYFFVLASWIDNYGLAQDLVTRIRTLKPDRLRSSRRYFEFHLIDDGSLRIVGFLTGREASGISLLTSQKSKSLVLSPHFCGDLNSLVSIPVSRIESSHSREMFVGGDESSSTVVDLVVR